MHVLIWRGNSHSISYSAHLKGKGKSGQWNRRLLWARAHPIQVTSLCDSLFPEDSQRGQKRKHASPKRHAWVELKGTKMYVCCVGVGVHAHTCTCSCTYICMLPQEGKPIEVEIQEAENVFKCLASGGKKLKQVEIRYYNTIIQNAIQPTFIRYLQCFSEDK